MKRNYFYIFGVVLLSTTICSFSFNQVKKPAKEIVASDSKNAAEKNNSSGQEDLRDHTTKGALPKNSDLSEPGINTTDMVESTEEMSKSYENTFLKMILTLIGLLAAVILSAWVLKKLSNSRLRGLNSDRSIKIIDKRPLSPKSVAYLLEVEGKKILVAESQVQITQLAEFEKFFPDK